MSWLFAETQLDCVASSDGPRWSRALVGVLSYPNVNQAHGGGEPNHPSSIGCYERPPPETMPRHSASSCATRPGRAADVADRLAEARRSHRGEASAPRRVHRDRSWRRPVGARSGSGRRGRFHRRDPLPPGAVQEAQGRRRPDRKPPRRRRSESTTALYDGDKVGIAVIDSGLEKSEDLSGGRADRFFDFTTNGRRGHPYDDYGHGTHVATLIAGEGKASEREVERPRARQVSSDASSRSIEDWRRRRGSSASRCSMATAPATRAPCSARSSSSSTIARS